MSSKLPNRLDQLFAHKKTKLLSLYYCAGHPQRDSTLPILHAIANSQKVDFVEIGIPYSDPVADGPVIQKASALARQNGMTLRTLFDQLEQVRPSLQIPIVLMGYIAPIMRYGFNKFFERCAAVGIDGVIIPDLPFSDYLREVKPLAEEAGVHVIMLITPETTDERIRDIDAQAKGFLYLMSTAGTTGAQQNFDSQKQAYFARIAAMELQNPCMVGFGISNRQTLEAAQNHAAGAIVGSRFVSLLDEHQDPAKALSCLLDHLNS